MKLGILVSGNGSNLQAILDACSRGRVAAEVALVLSDVPGAPALERAEAAGVEALCLDRRRFADREAFDAAAVEALRARGVDLVCLAGFMHLLSPLFVHAFEGRILNVHPSLLPTLPGLHAPRRALDADARLTGCTVHFVDEGLDTGPVLMQMPVLVLPGDDERSLTDRIQQAEHLLYPACIDLVARGRAVVESGRVLVDGMEIGSLGTPSAAHLPIAESPGPVGDELEPDRKLASLREAEVVLCSACLLGCRTRYDGTDKRDRRVEPLLAGKQVVPICPEPAGGLPIPRPPADFRGGDGRAVLGEAARVVSHEGVDVTGEYLRGANLALLAARLYGANVALLKENSPSCGTHRVYVGGGKVPGMGVAAAMLARAGVAVVSDEDLPTLLPPESPTEDKP